MEISGETLIDSGIGNDVVLIKMDKAATQMTEDVPEKIDIDGKWVKLTWLKSVFELDGNSSNREFILRPYLDEDVFGLIPNRAFDDAENWCAVMSLIHFALVEMFYGDRVLRKFGYHQPMPNQPVNMDEYEQIDTRGKSEKNWPVKHAQYVDLWNTRATRRPRCDPLSADNFDLSRCVYHQWLVEHRRGSSGSGSSSSAVGGSSSKRGSGAGGRARRARRATEEAKPEPEDAPQMEEVDVQFDTGSYPPTHGEPSWEVAIDDTAVEHGASGQVWRGQQPWSYVGVHDFSDGHNLSIKPFTFYGVGGAGPSMFRTPRRMNVEFEEDSDDEDNGQIRRGVDDDGDDDDDG
ncbi:hypothetical protein GQ457_13G018840 [Hibiscus cannabinus]